MWQGQESPSLCQKAFDLMTSGEPTKEEIAPYRWWSTETPINYDAQRKIFNQDAAAQWIDAYRTSEKAIRAADKA